jgi:hypothetical protein
MYRNRGSIDGGSVIGNGAGNTDSNRATGTVNSRITSNDFDTGTIPPEKLYEENISNNNIDLLDLRGMVSDCPASIAMTDPIGPTK